MTRVHRLVPLLVAAACATAPAPAPAPVTAGPVPAPTPAAPSAPTEQRVAPVLLELVETRLTIDEKGTATEVTREVYRLMVADPPGPWANVYAGFRPWTDEPPVLEATVVRPDGTTLTLDKATVSDQPEPREDGLLSDGKLRLAPLPGLTLGAVVDRTVRVTHRPQFVDGYATGIALAVPLPTKKHLVVVDVPKSVPVSFKVLNSELQPRREEKNGRVIFTIERTGVPAEPDRVPLAPPSSLTVPVFRFSTVKSWQAAAAGWAQRADAQLDVDGVRTLSREATKGLTTREEKARALLTWVHKNVRYTGLELGESAWVPFKPTEVLTRKYGDCKDLSLLLVSMLRAVDLEADLALVRAGSPMDVTPETPGLQAFDHAIVRLGGAPVLWLDATAPMLALGELPGSLIGHRALVARKDTVGLTELTSAGGSQLTTRVEITLGDAGPAQLKRVREAEGLIYSDGREVAARNMDEYRQNLERFAKEVHKSKAAPAVTASDPLGPGPFRESMEIKDSMVGLTQGEEAGALFLVDQVLMPILAVKRLQENGALEKRTAAVYLPMAAKGTVVNVLKPPPGYRLDELPDSVDVKFGPVSLTLSWKRGPDASVEGTLCVISGTGQLSAEDARKLAAVMDKVESVHVSFANVVLSAIRKERYYSAVKDAEELLKAHPSASRRALLAYALASAALTEAAREEAAAAVKEAPNDSLVRNRAAFVALHNSHGIEFGKGFERARALELIKKTLEKDPDDEWARRLFVLVSMRNERGVYLGQGVDLSGLATVISEYRTRTHAEQLDEQLIDIRLRQGDWKVLLEELPRLPVSPKRDAAWLAADIVQSGPEMALKKAGQEGRLSQEAVGQGISHLLTSRQYEPARKVLLLAAQKEGRDSSASAYARLLGSLKPCAIPQGDRKEPLVQLMRSLADDTLEGDAEKIFSEALSPDDRVSARRVGQSMMASFPGAAGNVGDFLCDFMDSVLKLEVQPLEGYGDVVTQKSDVPGLVPPMTMLLKKTKVGYRVWVSPEPMLAAEGLTQLGKGNSARAEELFRALGRLKRDEAGRTALEREEWSTTVPAWAALVAAGQVKTASAATAFLDKLLPRPDLTPLQAALAADAYDSAWKDEPARRLKVAKQLSAKASLDLRRIGMRMELKALRQQGAFSEARARVEAELKKTPDDRQLQAMLGEVAADLGDFTTARGLELKQADATEGPLSAAHLNNAAWYSIFGKPDDSAKQQAERAVQVQASAAHLNTLAAVYATLGEWDEAARAFRRQQHAEGFEDDAQPDPSYWYVRGRLAEAFGRKSQAVSAYKKMSRAKNKTADDTFLLAEPRLKTLER